ncbi:hypothetical protein KN200_15900 (plasmid) [Clavibacter michiganensis subsp. michiganensis]|uniref:hypothetical protein n=2 Tax=Clavibacter michiganensis TaxID=28447 RepID=UPI0016A6B667|nr:hypothetical protein [Clavibacter michiganensis]MDO4076445.1 hypothetical protein [Clavibacter michiganensis]MDO4132124.1 hypothetical protein [Clavibacter michiganensis]MDO4138080.1 hypothetical protein [Clavibacter michiganensis]NIY62096.1 hypothetical protein [Clavibacter michiganensis subsp. michiganensis]QXP07555.1 hypothetical protein KN200_15900 [Clavibacter michiganensis subsp. michiganensis]
MSVPMIPGGMHLRDTLGIRLKHLMRALVELIAAALILPATVSFAIDLGAAFATASGYDFTNPKVLDSALFVVSAVAVGILVHGGVLSATAAFRSIEPVYGPIAEGAAPSTLHTLP